MSDQSRSNSDGVVDAIATVAILAILLIGVVYWLSGM
ncbi:MAG: methionine synthase [Spongiibacteraceae bacterium]|jgi:hypothetical protein|nr:methionine synthase [Spongiibacteraceae bacterium]